jgi:hypothetical protein
MDYWELLFCGLCLIVGIYLGYLLNVESQAQELTNVQCGICLNNTNTLINNFNSLAGQCKLVLKKNNYSANDYRRWLNASEVWNTN